MYVIEYDIKSKEREDLFLSDLKALGDINLFLPRSFFLDCMESRSFVYESLRRHLTQEDLLFLVETDISRMSGWLPKSSVEWIREHSLVL